MGEVLMVSVGLIMCGWVIIEIVDTVREANRKSAIEKKLGRKSKPGE